MTPRDHFEKLQENIDGCKAQHALLKVYEADKVKDVIDSLHIICDELMAEVNKDRPVDIYGDVANEDVIKSAEELLNIKNDVTFGELRLLRQGLYDRYMNEVIRTYAYEESKSGRDG